MLPRCLAAVKRRRRRDRDRRHGLNRPHDRDRPANYGATVIEKEWTGSFSDARNASFEAATGDWIIYLDADEVLVADDVSRLRASPAAPGVRRSTSSRPATPASSATVTRSPTTRCACSATARTTASRAGCTSRSPTTCRLYAAGRVEQSSVRIDHYGYLGAVRDAKEKSRRNLDLLKAQQAESPSDAFLHFNLGTEYSVHRRLRLGADRVRALLEPGPEPGPGGPRLRAGAAPAAGHRAPPHRPRRTRRSPGRPGADAVPRLHRPGVLAGARRARARPRGRSDRLLAALHRDGRRAGAARRVGRRRHLPAPDRARRAYTRVAVELDAARELLDRCITEHPDVIARGRSVRVGAAPHRHARPRLSPTTIESRVPELTPAARFVLATIFFRHGAMAAAERQYRAILNARPTSSQIRVQLAEALLNERNYAEAATEAAADRRGRPVRWARLPDRAVEPDRVRRPRPAQAATRSRRARRRPEGRARDVRGLGSRSRSGTPDPELRSLPVAATPLLGVILETLLERATTSTRSSSWSSCSSRSALAQREQHELLGSMYLKHGFLQSAAREWMAVCESLPRRARAARAGARRPGERAARRRRGVRRRGAQARPDQRRRERRSSPAARRRSRRSSGPSNQTDGAHEPPTSTAATTRTTRQKAKEALKFSAMRSITPPERDGFPRNR